MESLIELVQPYFVQWGYLIVFLMALLENSAFVGAVVPGDVALLLAGFYAERSELDLAPISALAFFGALMPFPAFLVSVALAAGVWAVVMPIVGFLFSGSLEVVRRALGWAGVIIFILFASVIYWTYRRMVHRLSERTEPL